MIARLSIQLLSLARHAAFAASSSSPSLVEAPEMIMMHAARCRFSSRSPGANQEEPEPSSSNSGATEATPSAAVKAALPQPGAATAGDPSETSSSAVRLKEGISSASGPRRSLRDVLGPELTSALSTPSPSSSSADSSASLLSDAELEALFAPHRQVRVGGGRGGSSLLDAGGSHEIIPSGAPPAAGHQHQRPLKKHLNGEDSKYGFAILGGFVPEPPASSSASSMAVAAPPSPESLGLSSSSGVAGSAPLLKSLLQATPRIHPQRTFTPGQTYDPADLNAYAMKPEPLDASRGGRQQQRSPLFLNTAPSSSVEEVRRWGADYRNVSFLERFISSSGRIQSRRKTKLPMAEHKIVTKQIKVARTMGLISAVARLDKRHLRRLREEELRQAQEAGLV